MRVLIAIVLVFSFFKSGYCQLSNNIVFDEEANQEILYGEVTVDAFENSMFKSWFASEFHSYQPDSTTVAKLIPVANNISAKIVLATWCKDSRREVPRFLKLVEKIKLPQESISIIAVNRSKVCPEAGIQVGDIDFVPTFIFYRNSSEIGRIIESPKQSLEKDILYLLINE